MTAVVVEDEQHCRELLVRILEQRCPGVQVAAECGTVAAALDCIPRIDPDLVFLDIMLPDGTGFDVLQRLDRVAFKVIFTTAHDAFAIRAIRFSALDYLLKPVCADELAAAVDKASPMPAATTQIRLLRDNLASTGDGDKQIALPTLDGFIFASLRDLVSCEAKGNYSEFATVSGDALLVCRTLKEFEELLHPYRFFRIHHSHMINLRHLRRYVRGKGGYVIMANGKEFEVSVRRKESFIQVLGM